MTTSVLVSGELFRDPERKTSQSGKNFVRATLRVTAGNESEFWAVLSFSESVSDELMELHAGERLAVQGQLKLEIYNAKISRTVFASAVLPLRQKKRKPDQSKETKKPPAEAPPTPFDDSIPF